MAHIEVGVCPALTTPVYEKLAELGLLTVVQFLAYDLEELSSRTRITFRELLSIRRFFLAQYSCTLTNGAELYNSLMSSTAILSTGCLSLDQLLDGGLYTGELTEVVGATTSGKTQICLSAAGTTGHHTEKDVIYLDTSGGFSISRVLQMLGKMDEHCKTSANVESVLRRIHIEQVYGIFDLFANLERLKTVLIDQTDADYSSVKLVIVDCVSALFSPMLPLSGRINKMDSIDVQGYAMQLGRALKALAVEFSIAVLITSAATHADDGRIKMTFGKLWSSIPHTRLELRRHPNVDKNVGPSPTVSHITLGKSCRQQTGQFCTIRVDESGLQLVQSSLS